MLRWSDDWERRSLEHFREKWDLTRDEFFQARLNRLGWRRQNTILRPVARRLAPGQASRVVERGLKLVDRPLNRLLTNRYARLRQKESREAAGRPSPA